MRFKFINESILNEHFLNVNNDDTELKEKWIDRVWQVLEDSYDYVGGPLKSREDILTPTYYWKVVTRGDDVSAVVIYKRNSKVGRKVVLAGKNKHVSSSRDDFAKLISEDMKFNDRNSWMEVSEAMEKFMFKKGYIPIPNDVAKKVLETLVKKHDVELLDDGIHYQREIGGKILTKVMFGNPSITSNNSIKESLLVEDKIVKFNNQTYPSDGWCVILCGGPGSGKSTVLKNLIPIDAKIFDVDAIKQFAVRHGEISDNELVLNNRRYPIDDNIKEPYDLSNPEYVSYLHKTLKPLNNKIKSNIYKMGVDKDRKPNLAFDIAGSDINDFENIIYTLAPLGYKFCVVWVLNTLERALYNNSHRDRTGLRDLVIKKYGDVLTTVPMFMRRKDLMTHINDFWVVFSVAYDVQSREGKYNFIKETNVEKIDIKDNMGQLTDKLVTIISEQEEALRNV